MIAFIEMLLGPAQQAGMKVPEDCDNFDPNEYPHFRVYSNCQLGQSMPSPTSHWTNAKVIAAIPEDKIRTMTVQELVELGFEIGFPLP